MAKLDKMITYAYLKEECDLPVHLDEAELEHKIYRAQEMLRMLMSEVFYQDFLTQFKANTLTDVYATLFPYIKQFIAWQAHEFWIIKTNFKITNGGIRVHTEENSTIATDEQMGPMIKDAKYQAEYYKRLLTGYLTEHSTSFPLYSVCGCTSGNVFHISAVKNKVVQPQPYGTGSYKCCCND